uniref:protein-glutamine gamma-glutamyltransferase n=1 Tax=Oryzias latipes TaxID=8090 RepID=A0A3P9HDZ9_ORYLA
MHDGKINKDSAERTSFSTFSSISGLTSNVDLRSRENNSSHRTKEIDRDRLIVRRGQPFSVAVQICDSTAQNGQLELVLHLGKRDEVMIKVQRESGGADHWWFSQQAAQDEVMLTLHSPADAIIGQYRLAVLVMSPDGHIVQKIEGVSFHLLFNPWNKDDAVYLPEESHLQEYVMNETGIIYRGTSEYISSIPWNYGQFEDNIMDICFEVLDNSREALKNSKMDMECRADPVYISRIITAMVNANDDHGVLAGSWTPPYFNGVAPSKWTGSVPILRQWSSTRARAVKYGQCWVFAGVACTVLRCLGIPTRLITNFCSAHDVDGNLCVDVVDTFNSRQDSTWNFHCWVESWMRRDDLPKGNDGWQILDPTPQERSDGVFCCGPCPVTAIKEGNLQVKYDAPFVFAEVNADITHWRVLPNGQRQKVYVDQKSVGRKISTKSVYGDFREDLTVLYKYPEGSKEERTVFQKAGRRVTQSTNESAEPPQLQLLIKHARPVFGSDFDVIAEVRNDGDEDAQVQLTVLATGVTYNSVHQGECQRQMIRVTVAAHEGHREVLRLHFKDYAKCTSEHHLIRVKAFAEAQGQNQPLMTVADVPLSVPELLIQIQGKAVVKQQVTAKISFTNPLPAPLKGGVFTVEGAGLLSATQVHVKGEILPGQKVEVSFPFSPIRTGVRKLLVDFDSDRLMDVKGTATLVVRKITGNYIRGISGIFGNFNLTDPFI